MVFTKEKSRRRHRQACYVCVSFREASQIERNNGTATGQRLISELKEEFYCKPCDVKCKNIYLSYAVGSY